MPRVAVALLLTLALLPFSAGAAGHDVSTVRYASSGFGVGPSVMAANGSRFLTVWSGYGGPSTTSETYGALTETANRASSMPFLLPGVTGWPTAMTRWGDGFISLWWTPDHFDIVTLFANGGVQRVSHVPRIAGKPRFATNGRQLLVVDLSNDTLFTGYESVSASLYDSEGGLLARTALPIVGVTNFDVARAGNSYVVVTGGFWGVVHFFRLDDAGAIIADEELQGRQSSVYREPLVAVGGDAAHAVVAWTATNSTAAYATSISNNNDAGPRQPLPMNVAYPSIRVVPTASGFLICWSEVGHVSFVRTSASGQVIDAHSIEAASGDLEDAAAAGDQFALLTRSATTWYDPLAIVTGTVMPQLSMFSSPMVTSVAARQEQPVIASDGVDYVSVWLEHDGPDVMAKVGRVTRAGVPLDGAGVTLPAPTKKVWNVTLARGAGGDAVVVVSAYEGTWAFRWSHTAGLIDTAPIVLDSHGANFGTAVAFNGSRYLVTWSDYYSSSNLVGRFVGSDGEVAGAKFVIPMAVNTYEKIEARQPAIAWDGRQFLIASPTAQSIPCFNLCGPTPASEVRLARLSADGSAVDKTPYRILDKDSVRIATSGGEFLVVTSGYYSSLSAVVVKTAASGLSVSAPVMNIDDGKAGDVTWDGAAYDVAWRGFGPWLRLWRFDRSGNVLQKLFTEATTSDTPSAAANAAGEVAIGFSQQAPPSEMSRARIYFDSELQPVAPVPATPTNASGHKIGYFSLVRWDGEAPGFLIEKFFEFTGWNVLQQLSGDVHEALVYANVGDLIRVRAFGPDGTTPDGAITTIHSSERTRSVRR